MLHRAAPRGSSTASTSTWSRARSTFIKVTGASVQPLAQADGCPPFGRINKTPGLDAQFDKCEAATVPWANVEPAVSARDFLSARRGGRLGAGAQELAFPPRDPWVHFEIQSVVGLEGDGTWILIESLGKRVFVAGRRLSCDPRFKELASRGFVNGTTDRAAF